MRGGLTDFGGCVGGEERRGGESGRRLGEEMASGGGDMEVDVMGRSGTR